MNDIQDVSDLALPAARNGRLQSDAPVIEPRRVAEAGGHVLSLSFGLDGNSGLYCKTGWRGPELEHRWSLGPFSELWFPDLVGCTNYAILFTAIPFGGYQRVILAANGHRLAETSLQERGTFGVVVPARVIPKGQGLMLGMEQPDARSGRAVLRVPDDRLLGFAVLGLTIVDLDKVSAAPASAQQSAPLAVKELMLNFESLGDNCEFGIVQRRCGAEPLGLFRFAATRLQYLLAGLELGFSDIAEPEHLTLELSDSGPGRREYLLHQRKYDLFYHTCAFEGKVDPAKLLLRERNKLSFLHKKLMEDMREANKIFVIKSNSALPESAVMPLWRALRRYGPNTLLWVVPSDAHHPPGSVEIRQTGLLRGFIDRFALYDNATDVSIECWIRLCRNALRLKSDR